MMAAMIAANLAKNNQEPPSRRSRLLPRFLSPRFHRNGNGQQQLYAEAPGAGKAKARRLGLCPFFSNGGNATSQPPRAPAVLLCSAGCSYSARTAAAEVEMYACEATMARLVSRGRSVSTCSAAPVRLYRTSGATAQLLRPRDNSSQLKRGNLPDGHQLILVGLGECKRKEIFLGTTV